MVTTDYQSLPMITIFWGEPGANTRPKVKPGASKHGQRSGRSAGERGDQAEDHHQGEAKGVAVRNAVPTQDGPRKADAGARGGGSGSDGRAEARRPAGPRVCGASAGSGEHRAVQEADQWRPNGRKQRQEAMAGDASGVPRRKRRRNVGRAQPLRTLGQGRVAVGGRAA